MKCSAIVTTYQALCLLVVVRVENICYGALRTCMRIQYLKSMKHTKRERNDMLCRSFNFTQDITILPVEEVSVSNRKLVKDVVATAMVRSW